MTTLSIGGRIEEARRAAHFTSQRQLAARAGISNATLSRIIDGTRPAKANELLAVAMATGCNLADLTGASTMADRVECAARPDNGKNIEQIRKQVLQFLELDSYLEEQGIGLRP
ncbi:MULTISPECIES: helix-turn-helix domain-containing protein [unclassified Rhodococcus (in: high G+C Gram-positive bacteria)]|uniref:helix-turn-helix domain-containing protein n=1 Tax=Rhodococcus sp. YL-0 TaxID=1930581 RepID=UPI00096A94B2